MNPFTNILLDSVGAALTVDTTGEWFAFQPDCRTHNVLGINVVAGSGSITIQGRVDALSAPVELTTVTASDSQLLAAFKQMRVVVTAPTNLQVRVTCDRLGRLVS